MNEDAPGGEFYDSQYGKFATELYAAVRRETCGEDIGQNGWITADEVARFVVWLGLGPGVTLLDIACGSGGPALHMAGTTGCSVEGIDLHEAGIAQAQRQATELGMGERARFLAADASERLPFEDKSFDAVTCFDAINHMPDREAVLREWKRVLRPGCRVLFTDPITVTGPITDAEMRVRTSIGFFLMVPTGYNAGLLSRCGFEVEREQDATGNMATIARRWHGARAAREVDLRRVDGDEGFDRQQEFLEVTARLAEEGRLSRVVYLARA